MEGWVSILALAVSVCFGWHRGRIGMDGEAITEGAVGARWVRGSAGRFATVERVSVSFD